MGYFNLDSNKEKESQTFPPNTHNEGLLKSERRRERAVPPNGIWQTYGLSKEIETQHNFSCRNNEY